jgi:hypothetical protein
MEKIASMKVPWDKWDQANGTIVRLQGGNPIVKLGDGREMLSEFPRRLGCVLGDLVGQKVRIAFRPDRSLPPFIVSMLSDTEP